MEAKDTVIRDIDKTRVYYPGEVEEKLESQAEISFKAGIGEVVEWFKNNYHGDWLTHYNQWQAKWGIDTG